jgi:hypothetical protein
LTILSCCCAGTALAVFEYAEHAANCIEDHHRTGKRSSVSVPAIAEWNVLLLPMAPHGMVQLDFELQPLYFQLLGLV